VANDTVREQEEAAGRTPATTERMERMERMERILLAAGVDAMDKYLSIGPMFPGVIEQLKALQATRW
jgi:hypothetical protein